MIALYWLGAISTAVWAVFNLWGTSNGSCIGKVIGIFTLSLFWPIFVGAALIEKVMA